MSDTVQKIAENISYGWFHAPRGVLHSQDTTRPISETELRELLKLAVIRGMAHEHGRHVEAKDAAGTGVGVLEASGSREAPQGR